MIDSRKILPGGAELSAAGAGAEGENHMDESGCFFVSLLDEALYRKMRELALRAADWHRRCVKGHPGESA